MELNPFSFAMIFFIVIATYGRIRNWPRPFTEALHITMGSWFLVSCYHFLLPRFTS